MLAPRKVRWGLLGLALVLAAGPARAAEADKYLPPDADAVLHVNVQRLLDSALARKHLLPQIKKELEKKEAQQFLTTTGLDPLKDISRITIGSAGRGGEKVLVVVRGKFDLDKLNAAAQAGAREKPNEVKISKVGGKNLYEASRDGKKIYAAFADTGTLLVSPNRGYVVAGLQGKTGQPSKALRQVLAGVNTRQSIWGAGLVPEDVRTMLSRVELASAFAPKLRSLTGGVNVTDAVAVSLQIQMADARGAQNLRDSADTAKGVLAFLAQSNEEAAPFLNELLRTLQIKAAGTNVNINFRISEETIKKAVEKLPRQ